ncbi:hypothetical protein D2Q93_06860 [Alicyclobacillaceae bacterium I2511]|nr:hypothetical protein D2Q93_06860 [Alicyclobacillaceae bacterium I2511]
MNLIRRATIFAVLMATTVGCGDSGSAATQASGTGSQQDYGTTKQMVMDILHSTQGKQTLQEVLQDPEVKQQFIVNDADIGKAVEKSLSQGKNQSLLAQQFKDAQFSSALAKAVQPELLQMQKQLMKDPAYQQEMMVLLKSPDFSKYLQDYMQTPQYRSQVMKIMTDALQTPSFRMQFQEALKKAVADSMQSAGGSQQSSSQGNSSSGNSSSGNSSSGQGGEEQENSSGS